MPSPRSATLSLLSLLALASPLSAETTTTATILIPDWCVTQSQPTVTVLGQNDLTTYSYSCTTDSAAVSSASEKASRIAESAQSKASELRASLGVPQETDKPDNKLLRRDSSYECYGYDAFDACIPWEITQGASYWAVHYTVTGIVALDEVCTFGDGGVASGAATCTASGRLDPEVWGDGDGPHTHTFDKDDVNEYFIRNTVPVTAGGPPLTTGAGAATGTLGGSGNAQITGTNGLVENVQSTGLAIPNAMPTGAVAMMAGAGGILVAAIAL